MEVLLVRHGESADNAARRVQGWGGAGLTDTGRAEAAAAATVLKNLDVRVLRTSDLRRAAETADVIATALGIEAITDPAFREMRLGDWEGKTMRQVEESSPLAIWAWRYDGRMPMVPGIESVSAVLSRVLGGLERLRADCEALGERKAAVVSHGGALSMTLTHLVGLDCVRIWQMPTANGSISRLRWAGGRWTVVSWNETTHLPARAEGMNAL